MQPHAGLQLVKCPDTSDVPVVHDLNIIRTGNNCYEVCIFYRVLGALYEVNI